MNNETCDLSDDTTLNDVLNDVLNVVSNEICFNLEYMKMNEFLETKKQLFLTDTNSQLFRAFNPSVLKIDETNYLYCIRIIIINVKPDRNDNRDMRLIPGNVKGTKRDDCGVNFYWNKWHYSYWYGLSGGSVFVYGNHIENRYTYLKIIKKDPYCNNQFEHNIDYHMSDARLCRINDKIYVHDSVLNPLYEITLDLTIDKITLQ